MKNERMRAVKREPPEMVKAKPKGVKPKPILAVMRPVLASALVKPKAQPKAPAKPKAAPDLKISEMPLRAVLQASDEFPVVAGGVNFRAPISGITTTVEGVPGPPGPQGVPGPTGPQGNTGAAGPQGPAGATGATGAAGAPGATGAKGDKGDTGAAGAAGATGPAGSPDTAAQVLAKLITVDGSGSLLDADLLDGQQGSAFQLASSYTAADVLTKLLTVDGAGSLLDADLLDGQSGAYYLARANHTGTQAAGTVSGLAAVATSGSASDLATGTLPAARIAAASLPLTSLATQTTATILGNNTGSTASPIALTAAQTKTVLAIANTDVSGLGTAAVKNTGVSGSNVPLLDAAPSWSGTTTINSVATGSAWRQAVANGVAAWTFNNNSAVTSNINEARIDLSSGTNLENSRGSYISNVNDVGVTTCRLSFGSTGSTGAVPVERAYIKLGMVVGVPTGADKGVGTVNAVSVYDDNVLLTCMPMQPEFLAEGKIDLDKWDGYAPTGHHPAAHHFAELIAKGVDPRDPKKFISAMRSLQALPGMPTMVDWKQGELSVGEMVTRLWLAVEMLAVAWMAEVEKPEQGAT